MNHATCALSVTTVCLLYIISLAGCPPLVSAFTYQQEFEQDQINSLLSQFIQSPRSRDTDQWQDLQQLKQHWERDQTQSKRKERLRRRPGSCNPLTGKCSAGWKRSPPPSSPAEPLAADVDFGVRNIDLPQIVSSPYLNMKRAPSRTLSNGRRQGSYPRAVRKPKCNQFNGRCSAGWKRSPIITNPFDNHQPFEESGSNRIDENVFDVLDRLDDAYRQGLTSLTVWNMLSDFMTISFVSLFLNFDNGWKEYTIYHIQFEIIDRKVTTPFSVDQY